MLCALLPSCRLLQWAAFASAAVYLQLEDAAGRGLLPPGTTLHQLVAYYLWPQLPASLSGPWPGVFLDEEHVIAIP